MEDKYKSPVPPSNTDAEKALLCSIMADGGIYSKIMYLVDEKMFYNDAHMKIFSAMGKLFESNTPIDTITLANKLKTEGESELADGGYLNKLASIPSKPDGHTHYARIIAKNYVLREEIKLLEESIQKAYTGNIDNAVGLLESVVMGTCNILQKTDRQHMSVNETIREEVERIERVNENGIRKVMGYVSTGYHDLDALIHGFWPASSWALGGSSKVGKSTLLQNFAEHVALEDKIPYIFSLEMSKEQWVRKRLASESGVEYAKIITGKLNRQDWAALTRGVSSLSERPYFIDESPNPTLEEIFSKIKRAKEYNNVSFVGIDYIQRMEIPGKTARDRELETIRMAEVLKTLAKDLKITIMFASQLDEDVAKREDKKPTLTDLNGLERAVDVALLLHRPELYWQDNIEKKGLAELIVYSRFDCQGAVKLASKLECSRFENLSSEDNRRLQNL